MRLLVIPMLLLLAMPGCGDAPGSADTHACNLPEETAKLMAAREKTHVCTTMSLVRLKDNQYEVRLSTEEVEAVKALVQRRNLKISDDPGPSVAIIYRIKAGETTWGMLHRGLVLDGPTRETSESRRYRYECVEFDFGSPGPDDYTGKGKFLDEHVRANLRRLVELHEAGKLD